MSTVLLLQIFDLRLFDPIALLFLIGAGGSLYAVWAVIRHPVSMDYDDPEPRQDPATPADSSDPGAPRQGAHSR